MMIRRRIAIALAAASLGLPAGPAFAQGPDAPTSAAPAVPAKHREARASDAGSGGAEPKKPHARTAHVKRAAKPAAGSAAPAQAPVPGGETEAASLERRRRAFFGAGREEAAPAQETPSAGVTLGGSGGISPGMGFKF